MVEIISAEEFEASREDNFPEPYREFRDAQGIPVHLGLHVEDVNQVETGYWEMTEQNAAFLNLYGSEGVNDLQVHELEPGGETTTVQHFYDELVYVSKGNGITIIGEEDNRTTFEWGEQSLFCIPHNVPYRHINGSDQEEARLVAETGLPLLMNMVTHQDYIFNSDFDFWNAMLNDDFYSSEGDLYQEVDKYGNKNAFWTANFVPDIKKFDKLEKRQWRGAGDRNVRFPMPQCSMFAHVSEFSTGTYKQAHRHHPGAHVTTLSGEGYSLVWRESWDDTMVRLDWGPGSVFPPPALWFHQHFNTGSDPARYFALHGTRLGGLANSGLFTGKNPENQIGYVDEDPAIREMYESELEEKGLDSKMPDECYTNPDYEF